MYHMEILTNDNTGPGRFHRNNIHYLTENLIPRILRITPQKRHIYLIVNITYMIDEFLFINLINNLFLVFQFTRTMWANHFENLRIFADSGWAIYYHVLNICF